MRCRRHKVPFDVRQNDDGLGYSGTCRFCDAEGVTPELELDYEFDEDPKINLMREAEDIARSTPVAGTYRLQAAQLKYIPENVVSKMVKLATREAMRGNPLKQIIWTPPQTGSSDPDGTLAIEAHQPWTSGSLPPPWEL